MLQNKSLLLSAGLAVIAYLVYSRLNDQSKKEVLTHVEETTKQLMRNKGVI